MRGGFGVAFGEGDDEAVGGFMRRRGAIKGPGVVMGTYLVPKWSARVTGSVSCAKAKAANFSFVRPKLSQEVVPLHSRARSSINNARAASKQAPQVVNTLQNYVDVAFTRASQPSRL